MTAKAPNQIYTALALIFLGWSLSIVIAPAAEQRLASPDGGLAVIDDYGSAVEVFGSGRVCRRVDANESELK